MGVVRDWALMGPGASTVELQGYKSGFRMCHFSFSPLPKSAIRFVKICDVDIYLHKVHPPKIITYP